MININYYKKQISDKQRGMQSFFSSYEMRNSSTFLSAVKVSSYFHSSEKLQDFRYRTFMGWFKEVEYQENALVSVLFHASSTDFEAGTEKDVFIFIRLDKWQCLVGYWVCVGFQLETQPLSCFFSRMALIGLNHNHHKFLSGFSVVLIELSIISIISLIGIDCIGLTSLNIALQF